MMDIKSSQWSSSSWQNLYAYEGSGVEFVSYLVWSMRCNVSEVIEERVLRCDYASIPLLLTEMRNTTTEERGKETAQTL